jgi:hypothetical protein
MTYGWQDINGVELGIVGDLESVEIKTNHSNNLMFYIPYGTKYDAKTLQNEISAFCKVAKEYYPDGVTSSEIFDFQDSLGLDFAKSVILNILESFILKTKEFIQESRKSVDQIKSQTSSLLTSSKEKLRAQSHINSHSKGNDGYHIEKTQKFQSRKFNLSKGIPKSSVLGRSKNKISKSLGQIKSIAPRHHSIKQSDKTTEVETIQDRFIKYGAIFTPVDVKDVKSYIQTSLIGVDINDKNIKEYIHPDHIVEMAYQFILNRSYLEDNINLISLSYWRQIWKREITKSNFSLHQFADGYIAIEWTT